MTSRTKPRVISDSAMQRLGGFVELVGDHLASVNPGPKIDPPILGALPIPCVTAIVSPMARARPEDQGGQEAASARWGGRPGG